jgi:hypothetical protein
MRHLALSQECVIVKIEPHSLWNISTRLLRLNFFVLLGASIFYIYYYYDLERDWDSGSIIKYLLVQFNIASENVLAVWYSSFLLLLVSLLSGLCFLTEKQLRVQKPFPKLKYGWLLNMGIFGTLSLDEIGSLHERIGMLSVLNPFGDYPLGWVTLLSPMIIIVGIFMIAFAWFHVRDCKISLVFIVIGVALFLTIPIQEKLEVMSWQKLESRSLFQRPLEFLLLEEGAELFGMLMFLMSCVAYINKLVSQNNSTQQQSPVLELKFKLKSLIHAFIIIGFISGSMMLFFKQDWFQQLSGDDGMPQNWFVGMLAVLSSILAWLCYSTQHYPLLMRHRFEQLLMLLSLGLSAYYGASLKRWITSNHLQIYNLDDLTYLLITLSGTALGIYFIAQSIAWIERAAWAGWVGVLNISIYFGDPYSISFLDFLAMATLLWAVGTHLYSLSQQELSMAPDALQQQYLPMSPQINSQISDDCPRY